MPDLIRAFGAAACDSDSTYVSDDFGGAALWLPPGVEADIETLGRLIRSNADSAILSDVDAVFDAMARSQLISVRLMSRARRANAPELAYFQQRYFVNGAFTHHFTHTLIGDQRADPALETGDERVELERKSLVEMANPRGSISRENVGLRLSPDTPEALRRHRRAPQIMKRANARRLS